jgi:hypothetical protein
VSSVLTPARLARPSARMHRAGQTGTAVRQPFQPRFRVVHEPQLPFW